MSLYKELRDKQQAELNAFPMKFAFNMEQFTNGMKELGLNPEDTDKVYAIGRTGGFYRRTDAEKFHEMFERHNKEMQDAIKADTTGEGFIYDMFNYELANHEFSYTGDLEPTLDALGLTRKNINKRKNLRRGLELAVKNQREWHRKNQEL